MQLTQDPILGLIDGRTEKNVFQVIGLAGVLVLAACGSHQTTSSNRDIAFTHLEPYLLDVANLEIVNTYKPPFKEPFVEHLVPVSPSAAAWKWATHLLRPVGDEGTVRVTILDAKVVGEVLEVNQDLKSLFTSEQAARYDARIEITIDILDDRRISRAYVSGNATASSTVSEDATLAERDEIMIELIATLLGTLHTAITHQIEQFLELLKVPKIVRPDSSQLITGNFI